MLRERERRERVLTFLDTYHWILITILIDCTGADSLYYLTVEGLQQAVTEGIKKDGLENTGHCVACLTGNYPTDLDWWGVDPSYKSVRCDCMLKTVISHWTRKELEIIILGSALMSISDKLSLSWQKHLLCHYFCNLYEMSVLFVYF